MDLKTHELVRMLELENSNLKAALQGAADNLRDAEVEIGRLRREAKILKGMLPSLYRDDGSNGDRVTILRTATFPKAVRLPRTYLDSEGNTHRYDEQGLTIAQKRRDFDEHRWITEQDVPE